MQETQQQNLSPLGVARKSLRAYTGLMAANTAIEAALAGGDAVLARAAVDAVARHHREALEAAELQLQLLAGKEGVDLLDALRMARVAGQHALEVPEKEKEEEE